MLEIAASSGLSPEQQEWYEAVRLWAKIHLKKTITYKNRSNNISLTNSLLGFYSLIYDFADNYQAASHREIMRVFILQLSDIDTGSLTGY